MEMMQTFTWGPQQFVISDLAHIAYAHWEPQDFLNAPPYFLTHESF